jgi:hypothetical protein
MVRFAIFVDGSNLFGGLMVIGTESGSTARR